MKNQKKTEIKVGITVVVGLILFLWIFGWAKNFDPFSEKKSLTVKFESVSGLEVGDRIMIRGVRKGVVDDIYSEGNEVFVKASLDEDIDLRSDAHFAIMMLDLMGGKKIEIDPGISEERIDYDLVQTGRFYGDISTVMASFSSVENDIIDVIHQIKISLNSLNEILGEGDFGSDLKLTMTNINNLSSQISALVNENKKGLNDFINNGNTLTLSAHEILEENRENLRITLSDLSELIQRSNKLASRIDSLTVETMSGKNNLGKLIYDEKLLTDTVELLALTKDLIKIVLEQLRGEGINVNADLF